MFLILLLIKNWGNCIFLNLFFSITKSILYHSSTKVSDLSFFFSLFSSKRKWVFTTITQNTYWKIHSCKRMWKSKAKKNIFRHIHTVYIHRTIKDHCLNCMGFSEIILSIQRQIVHLWPTYLEASERFPVIPTFIVNHSHFH